MTASKGNGGPIEKAPAGTHPAVLVALIDLGTQWQPAFTPGEAGKYQHRLYWVYELPMEKKANGESHVIAIDLTWSLNEKAKMRQFIEARLGRKIAEGEKYDVSAELGQAVFLSVMANDKGYPKITNVSALPKSFPVPAPTYPLTTWQLDRRNPDFAALPSWLPYLYGKSIKDVIESCEELGGGSIDTPAAPRQTAAERNGQSERVATPPPPPGRPSAPPKPAGPREREFWVVVSEDADPVLMGEAKLLTHAQANGLTGDAIQVMECGPGGSSKPGASWTTAEALGLKVPQGAF